MLRFCLVIFVASVLSVKAEISNSKGLLYGPQSGPLCWGPGIWPHPESCRLFTICQLRYEVKGQLFICPEGTGFSTKHLKCIAKVLVPNCFRDSPLNTAILESSTAVRIEPSADEMIANACDVVETPYCRNEDVLVVCGPNNAYMGVVNCAEQKQGVYGRCDAESRACTQAYSPYLRAPVTTSQTQTSAPVDNVDIADDDDDVIESKSDEQNDDDSSSEETKITNSTTTTTTPDPLLPADEDLICRFPGLQCHDNITIMDCPVDLSEPNFVMSCANIIVTPDRNASGYCNAENPSCVMLVDGFKMNLEIALFNFGDDDDDSTEIKRLELDDLDDDVSEPELYDSDLLRESTGLFDGLSWFRTAENATRKKLGQKRVIKTPKIISVPAANGKTASKILADDCRGSLYCYDNSTLLACSGDLDTPTYAVVCFGTGVTSAGEDIEMHCDVKTHSCIVNFASDLTTTTTVGDDVTESSK